VSPCTIKPFVGAATLNADPILADPKTDKVLFAVVAPIAKDVSILRDVPVIFKVFVALAPSVKSILLLAGVISTSLGIYPYILVTLL
jgi:hypothetical protein